MTAERGVQSQLWLSRPSPLSGEGDLFKILLQASEPCRCHGMPKAECGNTKGGRGGTQTKPVNLLQRNLHQKSQSVYVAPQWLFSVGNAYRAGEIKKD